MMFNLIELTLSGFFLKEKGMENQYDSILFEKRKGGKYGEKPKEIDLLEKYEYDFSLEGKIGSHLKNKNSFLLVIDEISIISLLPLLETLDKKDFTIINCHMGITSYGVKHLPETRDITLINEKKICVYEPFDQCSFFSLLHANGKKIIRLADKELPSSIVQDPLSAIAMTHTIKDGDQGTVLCCGSMLIDCCTALGSNFDIFVLAQFSQPWPLRVVRSIDATKKLVIILDQEPGGRYEQFVKAQLYEHNLTAIKPIFIYPAYNNINTILTEYIYEQANFDEQGIMKKISPKSYNQLV